jgi:group II intron reverse transcriptase/maturase
MRPLGIATVLDRFIQQAVMQVLQADWDGTFSETSFGFRPGRSAHQAVEQAQVYIASGYAVVVDIDLEKFFDRVNHDILMGLVAKRVADKRILKLIRGFLTAGVLEGGLVSPTEEGTPQGGPLSPLLSNLMLDVLDKELEKRGRRFVRYADDCNIYVRSQRAGERPQVPGLQLHRWERTATAYCAAGDRPLQSKSPRTNAAHVRTKPRADRQGAVALSDWMARLLRLLPNPVDVAQA